MCVYVSKLINSYSVFVDDRHDGARGGGGRARKQEDKEQNEIDKLMVRNLRN